MKSDRLEIAINEAERFIRLAEAAKKRAESEHGFSPPKVIDVEYTKESAACRRASLDLTGALADLRKTR